LAISLAISMSTPPLSPAQKPSPRPPITHPPVLSILLHPGLKDWLPRDEDHVCVAAHSALMEAECFSESALHPIANNRRAQALGNGEAHSGILRLLRIPDSFRPRKMVQDQVLVSNRAAFPVHTFEIL